MLRDGSTVRGDDALQLIGNLLDDPGFWCELESGHLDVHVSEEAVYLGISPDKSFTITIPGLRVDAVAGSPYAEDVEPAPYRPATAEFWKELGSFLESCGSLLVLSQWAAGIGGEQWYLLQEAGDLSVVKADVIPRSIIAAFGPDCFIRIDDSSPAEIESFVGSDPLYGSLRWLTPDPGPKLHSSMMSDELDLREKCKLPAAGAVLFSWPEADTDGPVMAACPDEDGVVRTAFRFE